MAAKSAPASMPSSLEELRRLAESAGGVVMEVLRQRLERAHPGTLIGEGKMREAAEAVRRHGARTVIFDEELSPAQQKSLEEALGAKIIDRTRLILDIFARRARTKEGELQVELAQLSYMLPRLTGRWRAYSQQVGGIGTRGPGERQLEYERRHIGFRIGHLKRDIERMKRGRAVQRRRRALVPVPQVALIGYTNAGKSTMLNSLTREPSVHADDKLFATLDPTTRRVRMPDGGWVLFTDTVGFIQKLPTQLVAAFKSTLEEVARADCLVHVLDASSPNPGEHKRAVEAVLAELGAGRIPRVEALNKTDLLTPAETGRLGGDFPLALPVSAARGLGLEALLERVLAALHERWVLRELDVAPGRTDLLQSARRCAQVLDQRFLRGRWRLRLRVTPENWSRLRSMCR